MFHRTIFTPFCSVRPPGRKTNGVPRERKRCVRRKTIEKRLASMFTNASLCYRIALCVARLEERALLPDDRPVCDANRVHNKISCRSKSGTKKNERASPKEKRWKNGVLNEYGPTRISKRVQRKTEENRLQNRSICAGKTA